MPELKSVSLTVGRKALHSKPAGFNSPSNRGFNRFPNSVPLVDIILQLLVQQPRDPKFQQPHPWRRRRDKQGLRVRLCAVPDGSKT